MTILQVCAYAAPYEGNFIKSLKALGKSLAEKGHKMIYAFPENAKDIDWCKNLEKITDVYYLPLAKAILKNKTYKELKDIYAKYPDLAVIHSHFELYDIPINLTAPKDVKVFLHLHDAIQMYSSVKYKVLHKVQYGMLHKNSKLLSVSEKHKDYVVSLGFPKENTYFVPNGLDLDRIKLVETPIENREYDFLIFGWEFERKGVDLCVEAVKKLGGKVKIAVVGSQSTKEIVESRYGEVEGLEIIEPSTDINELYAKTKCFLHISRAEGLSYALLEAIYAGLDVICSDISENMFAQKFPSVTMVKSENIEDIYNAMKAQAAKKINDREKINISRKIIEDEYSTSSWVKHILEYYGV